MRETIETEAVSRWAAEAKETADHLDTDSPLGTCADHAWIRKGVKLSLRLLVCLLSESQSPRRQAAMNAGSAAVAVAVVELIRSFLVSRGADPAAADAVRSVVTAVAGVP